MSNILGRSRKYICAVYNYTRLEMTKDYTARSIQKHILLLGVVYPLHWDSWANTFPQLQGYVVYKHSNIRSVVQLSQRFRIVSCVVFRLAFTLLSARHSCHKAKCVACCSELTTTWDDNKEISQIQYECKNRWQQKADIDLLSMY